MPIFQALLIYQIMLLDCVLLLLF